MGILFFFSDHTSPPANIDVNKLLGRKISNVSRDKYKFVNASHTGQGSYKRSPRSQRSYRGHKSPAKSLPNRERYE